MVKRSVFSHFAPFIALTWGGAVLPLAVACAEVPLNRAIVQSLQNRVELTLHDQAPRLARVQDTLSPDEALSTVRGALAELRFDDGSLTRIGGQALVRFVSKTRTLQLSNGTLLLLVPPERGQTWIQTPNALASLRGSALFVRYVPETDTTLVGALTSGIEISNGDRSQTQMLGAGQLAVITHNRLEPAYRFDLKTFYETSALVKGLNLQRSIGQRSGSADGAIEAVRTATAEAVQTQAHLNTVDRQVGATETIIPDANKPTAVSRTTGATQVVPIVGQSDALLAQPTSINPSATTLLAAPTVTLPATIPPTLALPTNMPLVPATAIAPPPVLPNPPLMERQLLPNPTIPNPTVPNPTVPNPTIPNLTVPNPTVPNPNN